MQNVPFSVRMQMKKQEKPKGISKNQNNKPSKVQQTASSLKQQQKKQILLQILQEKCLRLPNLKNVSYFDPNHFISTLTQVNELQAEVVKFYNEDIQIDMSPQDVKAQICDEYIDAYIPRLKDLLHFCQENIPLAEQTLEKYRKKAVQLEKQTIQIKKLSKEQNQNDLFKNNNSDDEFDDTETKYNVKHQIKPETIFLTHNTNRITDIQRVFRKYEGVYAFFTKHHPIDVVIQLINNKLYNDCTFMITQPHRALKLLQTGALNASQLKSVILDLSYRDDKDKTAFEYEQNRLQLRVFCNSIQKTVKYWIL